MSRRTATIGTAFFDRLYAETPDPWGFATSDYERRKYDDTLGALRQRRYGAGLEVGASIGVFTARLAPRCERLVALEPSAPALAAARVRLAGVPGVTLVQGAVPGDLPDGRFDLVVLSEVLYYLDAADAQATMRRCCACLRPGGEIVLCHWLGDTDYPLSGDAAADLALGIGRAAGLRTSTIRRDAYRLDHLMSAE